jgi:hypothetical protein
VAGKPIGEFSLKTASTIQISDSRRFASAGEIDLAARTWKGKLSDMS